jgi:hypothetical protein
LRYSVYNPLIMNKIYEGFTQSDANVEIFSFN